MLQSLVSTASRMLNELNRSLFRGRMPALQENIATPSSIPYQSLGRVVLTDQVCRTIFDEYRAHRAGPRGSEETGWVLLGVREATAAVVMATLPAGADRSAGVAHVRFNAAAQAVASLIVRQWDRRLGIVGVVHTHPGSLRRPSNGDFQGDSLWVGQLRGREGVFGIGTADGVPQSGILVATQPKRHQQCLGELCFSWYALAAGERRYRPLPVRMTLGPDLARALHPLWSTLEIHAEALERLCRQQANVTIDVVQGDSPALAVNIPLAERGTSLRVTLDGNQARYLVLRQDQIAEVNPQADPLDRGVYLVMAELAGRS